MTSLTLGLHVWSAAMLVTTIFVQPADAAEDGATLKLALTPGTSMRYVLRGELHQEQTVTYNDDSTETKSTNQTFEQVVRYDIGAKLDDNSSEATVVLESLTLKQDDDPPVTRTDLAQARARLLSSGALRDVNVVAGSVADLDRLSIGAFAFEYPAEMMTIDAPFDRPFPVLLVLTWHSERISAHSQTKLTSVSPTSAAVAQDVDFHEVDVPVAPGITASADVTGTAMHVLDGPDGWPRNGQAEGKLETSIDASAAQADASADKRVPLTTAGSLSLLQSYERR